MAWLDVAEAAERLDVDARQVRRLLAGGDLRGQRIGRVWAVDDASVEARKRHRPAAGRPLGPGKAWAVLEDVAHRLPPHPQCVEHLLSHGLPARSRPVDQWSHWLRSRARSERVFLHPGLQDRFDADPAVRRVDPAPALGLSVADPFRFVRAGDLDDVLDRHHAQRHPDGPLEVRVLPPLADRPCDRALVTAAIVDLLASADARVRRAAHAHLEAAVRASEPR